MIATELERTAIAGRQQIVLARASPIPHRPDGVDHMAGREAISFGDFGVAGLATVQHVTLGDEVGAGRAMNGAIYAATTQQRRICGVDDGVNAERCDVSNNDFQPRRADLARRQGQTAASTGMPFSLKSCCNSPAWNISRTMSQPPTNSPLT
jgi:hypothetical protein